jgi:hypothetical protein
MSPGGDDRQEGLHTGMTGLAAPTTSIVGRAPLHSGGML